MPSVDEIIAYLRKLDGAACKGAEEYRRKAPSKVDTPYRQRIVEELGWSYKRQRSQRSGPGVPGTSALRTCFQDAS